MCGILAWVGPGPGNGTLIAATEKLRHRGPDAGGHWSDAEAFLGHRRLKVIDLSSGGDQPIGNEDGSIQVVFNGEIYNYRELRSELVTHGHRFRGDSDTEVIVHAYEEYGDDCVARLWGMFSFAVWDANRRRLFAARDRFGKKPLVYSHKGRRLALASEIPALLAAGASDRKIDLDALNYFWHSDAYVPAPFTAFLDIRKLAAGSALAFENGELRTWRYYPPSSVPAFAGTYHDAKDALRELIEDATARRLHADVPVGIALSGGIDSAVVVAAARKRTSGPLVTATVRPRRYNSAADEGDYARATAERFGTEHFEIYPSPDFPTSFETVVRNLGEPFAAASLIPTFYLFDAFRERATVVLTGDGGDESFAGYRHYWGSRWNPQELATSWLLGNAYNVFNAAYHHSPFGRGSLKKLLAGIQIARGEPMTEARSEAKRILEPWVYQSWSNPFPVMALAKEMQALTGEGSRMRRHMLGEMFGRMAYHINVKVDVCSMTHGLEARSPLLDHRVAEFARSIPDSYFGSRECRKRILKDIYADELPQSVLKKEKTGFALPLRDMLANELHDYALEVLTSSNATYDAMVRREEIPELMRRHREGKPHQTQLILKLLALRLWIEQAKPIF